MNVGYVLARRDLEGPALEKVHEEGKVKVYRVADPLPRAWVVHDTVQMPDDQALAYLNDDEFDPLATGVLPPDDALVLGSRDAPGGSAAVLDARPGLLVLDVSSPDDGLVVVSQPHHRDWDATVDGKPVSIHRVDYFLQGIGVSGGEHRVELRYHLPLWPVIVSLLAAAIGLVVVTSIRR